MMNIFRLIILSLTLTVPFSAWSCDACGCKLGAFSFDILPGYNANFIGLKYGLATFDAQIRSESGTLNETSDDKFERIEVIGQTRINDRFRLNWIIPLVRNVMDGNIEDHLSSGLGDPIVLANYQVTNIIKEARKIQHQLTVGFGIKLPIGQYDKEYDSEVINRNFQIGTGSVDFISTLNYVFRYRKTGLNLSGSFKKNTTNPDDFLYGDQTNLNANVFRMINFFNYSLSPIIGVYHEASKQHLESGYIVGNSGGNATFLNIGGQGYVGRFTFSINLQSPIRQNFKAENTKLLTTNINTNNRFSITVFYRLGKRKIEEIKTLNNKTD